MDVYVCSFVNGKVATFIYRNNSVDDMWFVVVPNGTARQDVEFVLCGSSVEIRILSPCRQLHHLVVSVGVEQDLIFNDVGCVRVGGSTGASKKMERLFSAFRD